MMRKATLIRRMDAEHERGRQHALLVGRPNPGIPERGERRWDRWAYEAGFAQGRREIEALRRQIDPPQPRDPARSTRSGT